MQKYVKTNQTATLLHLEVQPADARQLVGRSASPETIRVPTIRRTLFAILSMGGTMRDLADNYGSGNYSRIRMRRETSRINNRIVFRRSQRATKHTRFVVFSVTIPRILFNNGYISDQNKK